MSSPRDELTVYADRSCPLCRAEVEHYAAQDEAGVLRFVDVSAPGTPAAPDLASEQAMARFHVRRADGALVSGAEAFVAVWAVLPRWRWAARVARLPGMMAVLEGGYRAFLPIRPTVSRLFTRVQAWRTRAGPKGGDRA